MELYQTNQMDIYQTDKMNETIRQLFDRKSVRAFTDRPITEADKRLITAAAIQAPTAGNMSLFSMIEVESQHLKELLAERCDHQPMIARAPYVLMFLADFSRWQRIEALYVEQPGKPDEADWLLAMWDCMIAAQNAVVAAESLGIGSCYIGDIVEHYELTREDFALPSYVLPCALLIFGYPAPSQQQRQKPERFSEPLLLFKDRYQQPDEASLRQAFAEHEGCTETELAQRIRKFYERKQGAPFHQEMARACRAMIEEWCSASKQGGRAVRAERPGNLLPCVT